MFSKGKSNEESFSNLTTNYGTLKQRSEEVPQKKFMRTLIGLTGLAFLMVILGTAFSVNENKTFLQLNDLSQRVQVTAWNEYGSSGTILENTPYEKLQAENIILVEPFKSTKLIIDPKPQQAVHWTVRQGPPDLQRIAPHASHLTISIDDDKTTSSYCTMPGSYTVELQINSHDDKKVFRVICLYVKREIRHLTHNDRENLLDAMFEIWKNPDTDQGRLLYPLTDEGYHFHGIDKLVTAHHRESSGSVLCDKWHDGRGYLFHHLAFGLVFESSLRAIDKSLTLPYWDFTIEGEDIARKGLGPSEIIHSLVLSPDWFGETSKAGGRIENSRWKHALVTKAHNDETRAFANVMGYMRAPWNLAATPFVNRAVASICDIEPTNKPIPTCASHFTLARIDSLETFLDMVPGDGHRSIHVNTGGVFGDCDTDIADLRKRHTTELETAVSWPPVLEMVLNVTGEALDMDGIDNTKSVQRLGDLYDAAFPSEIFHVYRMLYRSQTCATDGQPAHLDCQCEDPDDPSTCSCLCKGIREGTFDWRVVEPCAYAGEAARYVLQSLLSEDFREDLITTMCSIGQVQEGEILESGSPSDPVFFLTHPVIDRLTIAKRLPPGKSELPFSNLGTFKSLDGQDSWQPYSFYGADRCIGHGPDDPALAYDLEQGLSYWIPPHFDTNGDQVISNNEFWHAIHPTHGALDYIYDNFEWNHCTTDDDKDASFIVENDKKHEADLSLVVTEKEDDSSASHKRLMIDVDCSLFDDDEIYPSIPGTEPTERTDCQIQDSISWCDTCQASQVCTQYCGDATALCSHNPSGAFQYINPCLWEMIASLPQVCAGIVQQIEPPLQSRNVGSTVDGPYTEPTWTCNWHSMCQACSTADGELNKYCRAVIARNHYRGNGVALFLHDLEKYGTSYWCQPDILRSIEDGSFFDQYSQYDASN